MAVIINVEAFRDALPPAVHEAAAGLRRSGGVGELELAGGGVQAVVHDGATAYQPWVGVVGRVLSAECGCASDEDWCGHAVAVALAAVEQEVRWSGAATPPSAEPPR